MEKPTVLIKDTENEDAESSWITVENKSKLQHYFNIVCLADLDEDPSLLPKIQGLLMHPLDARLYVELIPNMPNLKAIVCLGAGYDTYYPVLKPFGIPIANTPDSVRDAVADFTMALVLSTACHIPQGISLAMRESPPRKFTTRRVKQIPGVNTKTLGIIGMGRIGVEVAKRAGVFNMKILYHNRKKSANEVSAEYCGSLSEMLPQCDFVVTLCPLTPQTRAFIGKKEFQMMKKSAIFINVARGQVVDQEALVEALTSKTISFAALDVTYPEPLSEGHPLLKLDNVLITPHTAVSSHATWLKLIQSCIENLKAALIDKRSMPNLITE